MKDKQVAWLGLIGFGVFLVSYLADSSSEGVLFWAGLIAFYTGVVWAWVKLFKSDN